MDKMLDEDDLANAQTLNNDHHTRLDCGVLPGMNYIYYLPSAVSVHTCRESTITSSLSLSNDLPL